MAMCIDVMIGESTDVVFNAPLIALRGCFDTQKEDDFYLSIVWR